MNNAIKGKKNRAAGELFEKMISASCDWYLSEKVAKIEKQSEPMKVIKPLSLGRFVACFAKKSGVDYKGTLAGGKAVCFEAKHTDTKIMPRSRLEEWQIDYLKDHMEMGAITFVLLSFGLERFYRIPFEYWLNMKQIFGKISVSEKDIQKFRIPAVGGKIKFLDNIGGRIMAKVEAPCLPASLIHLADVNSFAGNRGKLSQESYNRYVDRIMSWNITDSKKISILKQLHSMWLRLLNYEANHVSVMVAGPAKYNAKKLDKSDEILQLYAKIKNWIDDLESQLSKGYAAGNDKKVKNCMQLIAFSISNNQDPKIYLQQLAKLDNQQFIKMFEKLNIRYKWRKNTTVYKLYQASLEGKVKETTKEVFFQDGNLTAYIENERAFIKFTLKPKRQLIVALKSRGWFWNAYEQAWSTFLTKLDKDWVRSISEKYVAYV